MISRAVLAWKLPYFPVSLHKITISPQTEMGWIGQQQYFEQLETHVRDAHDEIKIKCTLYMYHTVPAQKSNISGEVLNLYKLI